MRRIIIDCDPGIDDAQAIIMAHQHPEVNIQAITTVAGNVSLEHTTANALKILDVLNAGPIPVYRGARMGLVEQGCNASFFHGEDGLGDAGIPASGRRIEDESAALALIRHGQMYSGALELVAIGPLTNLALALHLDPDLPTYFKRLVIMGGAYLSQGNTPNLCAEFNIYADPEAAKVVFDHWPKLTMVSWEATLAHGIPPRLTEELLNLDTERSAFFEQVSRKMRQLMSTKSSGELSFAADPLAMTVLLEPNIIQDSVEKYVQIETHGRLSRGMTVVDWSHQSGCLPNAEIVRSVDNERFWELFRLAFE